uniref:CXXC-type domain-containing protein n=1 Tax=Elaeophora elaphi TaxID=1147741 RepID=A0A0R3RFV3_9BILA
MNFRHLQRVADSAKIIKNAKRKISDWLIPPKHIKIGSAKKKTSLIKVQLRLCKMRHHFILLLFLSISISIIHSTKAKAASATRSKNNHAPAPNAEIDGEIAAALDDAVTLTDTEPQLKHNSLTPTSDSKSKHELENSIDGAGRTRRSCGVGGSCGSCSGCGGGGCSCGACGCCQSCCQKSCCSSTCTTCTTTTTCCKTCCQQCCQCCGCGSCGCGGGSCGGDDCGGGGGGHGRKRREIMELLGGHLLREKRSPRNSRRHAASGAPIKKTTKHFLQNHLGHSKLLLLNTKLAEYYIAQKLIM